MEDKYTEPALKKLDLPDLFKIAVDNEIKVSEETKKDDLIKLIVDKGCLLLPKDPPETPSENNSQEDPPEDVPPVNPDAQKYTKEQLLKSHWYSHKRNVLETVLEDGQSYTLPHVDWLLKRA
jgi:hypothetical protein